MTGSTPGMSGAAVRARGRESQVVGLIVLDVRAAEVAEQQTRKTSAQAELAN